MLKKAIDKELNFSKDKVIRYSIKYDINMMFKYNTISTSSGRSVNFKY